MVSSNRYKLHAANFLKILLTSFFVLSHHSSQLTEESFQRISALMQFVMVLLLYHLFTNQKNSNLKLFDTWLTVYHHY